MARAKAEISVDFTELENFKKELEKLQQIEIEKFLTNLTNEIAARVLRRATKRTPVDTGNLRRSWAVSKVEKKGDFYEIVISNSAEYATYVEYGHRQRVGRYVPAIGKRLKEPFVEGQFILTKSMLEVEEKVESIIEEKLEKLLKGVFS